MSAFLILFFILIPGIGVIYRVLSEGRSMMSNNAFVRSIVFNPDRLKTIKTYLEEFPYYKSLTPQGKEKFTDRVIRFMINKRFAGAEGLEVTEEMRVKISACAVQLTFGLDHFILPNLDTIILHPSTFIFAPTGQDLKGGTTPDGSMHLSWKDFVQGYADPEDRYNLGLHEFGHALLIEILKDDGYDEHFNATFPEWKEDGMREILRMRGGENSFLRKYASTNLHEFFAVSVEHFFERAAAFQTQMPRLYDHLRWLLNQDPLKPHQDYRVVGQPGEVTTALPVSILGDNTSANLFDKQESSPAQYLDADAGWHWSLSLLLGGIFVGIPAVIYFGGQNALSVSEVLAMVIVFGFANFISWPYFRERRILNKIQFGLYSFIGVGTWCAVVVLGLNKAIPVGDPVKETYDVRTVNSNRSDFTVLHLGGNAYDDCEMMRTFLVQDISSKDPKQVTFTFRRGIFGIRALQKTEFVFSDW